MPNNYLSVLYKHIIQLENKNVGLNVGGTNIPTFPSPPPRPPLPTPVFNVDGLKGCSIRCHGESLRQDDQHTGCEGALAAERSVDELVVEVGCQVRPAG